MIPSPLDLRRQSKEQNANHGYWEGMPTHAGKRRVVLRRGNKFLTVVAKKPISNTRAQMHGLNGITIQSIFNWCRGSFYFSLQKEADNVADS